MLIVRILVVEDERKLAQALHTALKAEHYEIVAAPNGEDGFFRPNAERFDLVLLDLMLPGRNGLEILQTLRKRQVQTPVLILTARDGVEDRVLGLGLGADDCSCRDEENLDLIESAGNCRQVVVRSIDRERRADGAQAKNRSNQAGGVADERGCASNSGGMNESGMKGDATQTVSRTYSAQSGMVVS